MNLQMNWKGILFITVIIISVLFLFKTCEPTHNQNNDLQRIEQRIDSLWSLSKIASDSSKYYKDLTDSLLKIRDKNNKELADYKRKLDEIKRRYKELLEKIKTMSADYQVSYLADRLQQLDTNYKSNYPALIDLDTLKLITIDTFQTMLINQTFVTLDEKTELLDTALVLIKKMEEQLKLDSIIFTTKDGQIRNLEKDTLYKRNIILSKDTIIIDLNKKVTKQKWYIRGLATLAGILAILGIVT